MPAQDSASIPGDSLHAALQDILSNTHAPSLLFHANGSLIAANPRLEPQVLQAWQEAVASQVWPGHFLPPGETLRLLSPTPAHIRRAPHTPHLLVTPEPPPDIALQLRKEAHDLRLMLQALSAQLETDGTSANPAIAQSIAHIEAMLTAPQQEDTAFNIGDELRTLTSLLRPLYTARGVTLTLSAPQDVIVSGARQAFRKLLQNLVQNAAAQSTGGEVAITLKYLQTKGKRLLFTLIITDEGAGLPQETLERISRGTWATTAGKGHGYGLGIISEALKELNADINSTRTPKHSLQVRFRMSEAYGRDYTAGPALTGKRVLLVEDDLVVRDLISRLLASHGIELRTADGLAQMQDHLDAGFQPDICILDYMLRGTTAVPILQYLREAAITAPKLILTGDTSAATREICKAAGATAVALKPISSHSLLKHLQGLLTEPRPSDAEDALPFDRVIDIEIMQELIEELGTEATQTFMQRALREVEQTIATAPQLSYQALRQPLHSAIGACSMTGLRLISHTLLRLQEALKSDEKMPKFKDHLHKSIDATHRCIALLPCRQPSLGPPNE